MSKTTTQDLFGQNSVFVNGNLYLDANDLGVDRKRWTVFGEETGNFESAVYYILKSFSKNYRAATALGHGSPALHVAASGVVPFADGVKRTFYQDFVLNLGEPSSPWDADRSPESIYKRDSFEGSDEGRTIIFQRPENTVVLQVEANDSAEIWAIHVGGRSATTSKGVVTWDESGYLWKFIEEAEEAQSE